MVAELKTLTRFGFHFENPLYKNRYYRITKKTFNDYMEGNLEVMEYDGSAVKVFKQPVVSRKFKEFLEFIPVCKDLGDAVLIQL